MKIQIFSHCTLDNPEPRRPSQQQGRLGAAYATAKRPRDGSPTAFHPNAAGPASPRGARLGPCQHHGGWSQSHRLTGISRALACVPAWDWACLVQNLLQLPVGAHLPSRCKGQLGARRCPRILEKGAFFFRHGRACSIEPAIAALLFKGACHRCFSETRRGGNRAIITVLCGGRQALGGNHSAESHRLRDPDQALSVQCSILDLQQRPRYQDEARRAAAGTSQSLECLAQTGAI